MSHGRDGRVERVRGGHEGLTTDQLRAMLAEFGIYEKPAGPNGEIGYRRADFEPVWKAMGIRP